MCSQFNRIRTRIDEIDKQLLDLLNERARRAEELGNLKKMRGLTIRDNIRENTILARVREANPGPLSSDSAVSIFEVVIRECRRIQEDTESPCSACGINEATSGACVLGKEQR